MKRILILGCGDVARRALPWLCQRFEVRALARSAESAAALRALGVVPVMGNLDTLRSLRRLAGLADIILHCAPPQEQGADDLRTRHLLAALARGQSLARSLVYISTSGVYGDHAGAAVSEAAPQRASTPRARRRVAAEQRLRRFAITHGVRLSILRAPGIYAAERLSLARLQRGDPVLQADEDVFTNHIHADDLARALIAAMFRARGGRSYNISDDAQLKMGDYYDAMADIFALPRPPRATRAECAQRLSPMMMSFMGESRRLDNQRMKAELRLRLQWPDVLSGLQRIARTQGRSA
ncbi:SDR family oxidoreductase [Uliginosibacterium sediminicola]|uniref:SDR family oxidoreductase n=1 Tax=Uliginosibacterium sediminicola TaxID=2024550 RepID=A0ABU9YX48_9RHOO